MGTAATIVLADAATPTPANHSFLFTPDKGDLVAWEDRAGGQYVGYPRISLDIRTPAPNRSAKTVANRNVHVSLRIRTPIMEVVGTSSSGLPAPPTVSYTPQVNVEFILPERSQTLDRATLIKYLANVLLNTQIANAVTNFERPY